ncbi:BTAD domain-containing putative transcriptional regulator [Streptomyces sp. NPDC048636]|uniref:AfsR/SARP family transcriptional regulator n=1 Tax=Streptomyces sp. NPDC048636 TaxID=3155762 RepID=UPI0034308CC5
MEFRILGPVRVRVGGTAVPVDGAKQRTVLAALLLSGGRVLSDDRLSELLWGPTPPPTRTAQLYTYVSRLRKRCGPWLRTERRGNGYAMDVGGARYDWDEFRRLSEQGRTALTSGHYATAADRLTAALALWHGPALSDVTGRLAEAELPRLEEARIAAVQNRIEAELALGRHAQSVPELTRLVAEHPLRETLRCQLMTALYRCDRQADALAVYERGRRALRDELGVDPGAALRRVHRELLTGELTGPAAAPKAVTLGRGAGGGAAAGPGPGRATAAGPPPADIWAGLVPAMLPPDIADFTGRAQPLAELGTALADPHGTGGIVLTGAPGTGTSALAVHAAHRCRAAFPHGQLYADLRAEDGTPKDPSDVLGWFLRALGTGPHDLPAALDERAQLYRSRLAGRRALVVLDNAVEDRQVRPLLTVGDGCRTLVTSHSPLTSVEGVRLVRLGPLDAAEARGLLAAVAGTERVAAEPEAAGRIVERCDGLPLALRICAARLAAQPQWRLAHLANRLVPVDRLLGELSLGSLDVRAALRRSHVRLAADARHAFRALAHRYAAAFTARDAAAELRWSEASAEDALDSLTTARLLELSAEGDRLEYRFPSLVRQFAREQDAAEPELTGFPGPALVA